jgi:hypothetical protein
MGAQPALAGRVRQVEVQPDEFAGHRLAQPGDSLWRADSLSLAGLAHDETPHQSRIVGTVAERRQSHDHPMQTNDGAIVEQGLPSGTGLALPPPMSSG